MTENQVQEFILAEVRHILGDDHVAPGTKLLERFDELDLSDFVMGHNSSVVVDGETIR